MDCGAPTEHLRQHPRRVAAIMAATDTMPQWRRPARRRTHADLAQSRPKSGRVTDVVLETPAEARPSECKIAPLERTNRLTAWASSKGCQTQQTIWKNGWLAVASNHGQTGGTPNV